MIIEQYRWVTVPTRAYASASTGAHKQGWLPVGLKLHCVEQSSGMFRFDLPRLESITDLYPLTWVEEKNTTAQPPIDEGETPPDQPTTGAPSDAEIGRVIRYLVSLLG